MMNNPTPFNRLRLFRVLKWVSNGDSVNLSTESQSAVEETADLDEADIVSSEFRKRRPNARAQHMVVLDIDVPIAVIPSSTPGHSHLFIDARMSWDEYSDVLSALANAGIIEAGYAAASKARGFSAVRLPWVRKDVTPDPF